MSYKTGLLVVTLTLLDSSPAEAEAQRIVAGSRISLADIVPDVSTEAKGVDLGPTPPAGSSRLITPSEVETAARQAGFSVRVAESVRVFAATKLWTPLELREALRMKLERALPAHARLRDFVPPRKLLTTSSAELSRVVVGPVPSRQGVFQTSVIVEVTASGRIEHRLAVPVSLELREAPKPVELAQGTVVSLIVQLGSAQISTAALTLEPAAVGSVALVRVVKTRKTLRARLLTPTSAELMRP